MKTYVCSVCGFMYDENEGHPDSGILKGTEWEKVAPEWLCPDCGVGKDEFSAVDK